MVMLLHMKFGDCLYFIVDRVAQSEVHTAFCVGSPEME